MLKLIWLVTHAIKYLSADFISLLTQCSSDKLSLAASKQKTGKITVDWSTYMSPARICGLLFPLHIQQYRPCWLSDILCPQRPSDLRNLCCPLLRLRCALYWAFQGQISHVTQERKHISVEARKLICCALAITLEPEWANQHTDAGLFYSAINI